jgi:hypothetical protein
MNIAEVAAAHGVAPGNPWKSAVRSVRKSRPRFALTTNTDICGRERIMIAFSKRHPGGSKGSRRRSSIRRKRRPAPAAIFMAFDEGGGCYDSGYVQPAISHRSRDDFPGGLGGGTWGTGLGLADG